ncbi:MAG: hypothetical protein F6K55_22510 [Moorea sp. SIO4A3]|nr:hypothetical protein [Moorena sp. SIO4A3]
MPEEIQIQDPDGSETTSTASTGQASQQSAEATIRSLSTAESERLSLEELEAREARYGARKSMGPSLPEEPEAVPRAVVVEEVPESEPTQLPESE